MYNEKDFHKYVYWLGDSIPEHMQNEARNFFTEQCKEDDIPYIICISNPFTWGNAIRVIKQIGYPKNKLATERIMYLFQDVNWEFTNIALSVIKEIYIHEPDIVINAIESSAKLADKLYDTEWLFGLSWVKENLKISKNDFKESETINILYKGEYWNGIDEIE